MDDTDRRKARKNWPIRRFSLGQEPVYDERFTESVSGRIARTWKLSREAYALSGKELPVYSRNSIPGKILRNE